MKVDPNSIELITGAVKEDRYPGVKLPEATLSGRSNVGKSTFINSMTDRRNMACTSQQPGKTQTLNFCSIDKQLTFMNASGYGYVGVGKTQREEFGRMIEEYITERGNL